MGAEVLLTVRDIDFAIGGHTILQSVSLRVARGQIVTLIGPNGAGKSTLVRIVLGLRRPSAGRVELLAGARLGYMPQRLALDPTLPLTVQRFVTLGTPASRARVQALLASL